MLALHGWFPPRHPELTVYTGLRSLPRRSSHGEPRSAPPVSPFLLPAFRIAPQAAKGKKEPEKAECRGTRQALLLITAARIWSPSPVTYSSPLGFRATSHPHLPGKRRDRLSAKEGAWWSKGASDSFPFVCSQEGTNAQCAERFDVTT